MKIMLQSNDPQIPRILYNCTISALFYFFHRSDKTGGESERGKSAAGFAIFW